MADPIFSSDFNDATVIGDVTGAMGWDNPSQTAGSGAITLETVVIPRVGTKSIKCVAPAYDNVTIARAALQKIGFAFSAYTEAWIEWYLYITSAASYQMLGLLDIEDADHPSSLTPGTTLYMGPDRMLHSALVRSGTTEVRDQVSVANNPRENQMPVDQWVKMRAYLYFDNDPTTGRIKVWRDDALIMDAAGRTMPPGMYVTDRIQLGITNHEAPVAQTLYIADVRVWTADPGDGLSPGGSGRRRDLPKPEMS